jgi:hypothetical protein
LAWNGTLNALFHPVQSIHELAQALASCNVQDCSRFIIEGGGYGGGGGGADGLDASESLSYVEALLPLQAAEWPKHVTTLKVGGLTMDAAVDDKLHAIFPHAHVSPCDLDDYYF